MALWSLSGKELVMQGHEAGSLILCENRTDDGKIILSTSVFVRSGVTY